MAILVAREYPVPGAEVLVDPHLDSAMCLRTCEKCPVIVGRQVRSAEVGRRIEQLLQLQCLRAQILRKNLGAIKRIYAAERILERGEGAEVAGPLGCGRHAGV